MKRSAWVRSYEGTDRWTILRQLAVACALLLAALYLLQRLLVPKYTDDVVEGRFVAEYYREPDKSFDVLFVGDCEVYENFSPVALWNEYGIHSYIRGSAQQYIWQSYYLLKDALRDHVPRVVVFNVQALQYDEAQREAYNRMTLDGMRWSADKARAVAASMTEGEHFAEYVFPILRFHGRWDELSADDVKYLFRAERATFNGYYLRADARPAQDFPEGKPLADYAFGEKAWSYLDALRVLCAEYDIALVLVKAPSLYPYWYPEWEAQVEDYAARWGLSYINYYERVDVTGLDYETDTYDGGLHMNVWGATKLSRDIGAFLREMGVPDRRGDASLDAIWEAETAAYEAEIARQIVGD